MERIGGETLVLLADLRERLEVFEAMRGIATLPGEFTIKTVKGIVYHYFQATLPSGRTQIYIGPDSEEVRRLIEARRAGEKDVRADKNAPAPGFPGHCRRGQAGHAGHGPDHPSPG